MPNYKILLGLTEIAGYFSSLKYGFDQIEVKCDFITKKPHRFNYNVPDPNCFQKIFNYLSNKLSILEAGDSTRRVCYRILYDIVLIFFFLYSMVHYNVFIFGFKQTFFPKLNFFDLKILENFKR